MKITEDVRKYAAQKGIDEAAAIEQGLHEKAEGISGKPERRSIRSRNQ
jgi:hypothetical protein